MRKLIAASSLFLVFIALCTSCNTVHECYGQASDFYQHLADFPYFSECETNTLTLQIATSRKTNGGTPFYVLLKATDFAQFLREDYQEIASAISFPDENPAHLATLCLIPGSAKTIKIKKPKDKSIAIFCLFTYPGEIWKHIIDNVDGPQKIKVILGENEIKMINIY